VHSAIEAQTIHMYYMSSLLVLGLIAYTSLMGRGALAEQGRVGDGATRFGALARFSRAKHPRLISAPHAFAASATPPERIAVAFA